MARARADLDLLLPHLGAPWLDWVLRDRVQSLARRCGRTIELAAPSPLAIGESWLLLAGAGGHGRAARMRVALTGSDAPKLDRRQTLAAVRGLAAAASRGGYLVSVDALSVAWELAGEDPPSEIEGDSLGLSACVALLSSLSKVAPHTRVAGSASVAAATGALGAVHHLEAKLTALRAERPEVTHLVVSAEQPVPDGAPFEILRCATVVEAVSHFGLGVGVLPKPSIEALKVTVDAFDADDARLRSLSEWAALSTHALAVASLLGPKRPELAVRARIWAALFASHAADNVGAGDIVRAIDVSTIREDEHLAMRAVVLATTTIDEDPSAAAALGMEAVSVAERLRDARGSEWYGRALGTHGRALMHAGSYAAAERLLRAAYEHHEATRPEEAGRSACYLACCLRLADQPDAALVMADLALHAADAALDFDAARSTKPYALLERARALLALRRLDAAVPVLVEIIAAEQTSHRYPRLGAHRTLARVLRELGRLAEAEDHLRCCWEVTSAGVLPKTARRLGAVAALEEIEHATSNGRRPFISSETVDSHWFELFGNASRSSVLATWVY